MSDYIYACLTTYVYNYLTTCMCLFILYVCTHVCLTTPMSVYMQFRTGQSTADAPFGTFNPETVRRSIMNNNISFSDYVNPLMTSMECLNSKHFGNNRTITGKDILDPDWNQNPDFYGHNHILIPYCSSDLWLADEVLEEHSCKCGNLTCFDYKANSEKLQFAFRGKLIFQSIFKQLKDDFGMNNASEILLVGSSAGGVGVVNLAQWVREETPSETDLLILFDSSWFVNFQDGIYRIFDGVSSGTSGTTLSDIQEKNNRRLLEIVSNHTACADVSLGYPCCISAYCVMTTRNESGNLAYFPESGQRTFFLGSVYDIFLLAPAVMGLDDFSAITNEDDEDASAVSLVVDFVRLTGEYGGEMNSTLTQTFNSVRGVAVVLLKNCSVTSDFILGPFVLISGGQSSTVYRGVLISGCWNRGVPLHTEVSSFQGVGIEEFHCIQRCPHFRVLE